MQKLKTHAQKERKNRVNQLIVGFILIFLMVFGTVGYALSGNSGESKEKIKYKDIEFIREAGYWRFVVDGRTYATQYNPLEVEDIPVPIHSSLGTYKNQVLNFVVGTSREPYTEITGNIFPHIQRVQEACLAESSETDMSVNSSVREVNCSERLPDKDCTNNMIVIREPLEGDPEVIFQKENCVFIEANLGNQTKFADAFLFDILGI